MNRFVVFAVVVLLLSLGLATTSCIVSRAEAQVAEAEKAVRYEQGKRLVLEASFKAISTKASAQESANEKLAEKVETLERKLRTRPVPAPPSPAPNTDPELTAGLVSAGLSPGLKILDEAPSTMFRTDAKLAWTWKEDAARVPGLEAHVAARIDLEKGMKDEIGGLKTEIKTRKDMSSVDQSIKQSQATVIATLNQATKAAQKEAKAQYAKGWMKAVGAAAIGYVAGKAMK